MMSINTLKQRRRRLSAPVEVLADILETNGITQTELARRLKVSPQTVHQL